MQAKTGLPAPFELSRAGIAWTLTPRARYSIQAEVLGVERYRLGWAGQLVPCDLALGWGELISRRLHHEIDWSQGGRWYRWTHAGDFPESDAFVAHHSANTHVIPASDELAAVLCALKVGAVVQLDGLLVDLAGGSGADQYRWKTSTSRTDRADGSCELMWVTTVRSEQTRWSAP